jgi:SAM-dependent methyltransferase
MEAVPDLNQHNREIHSNAAALEKKPQLLAIYDGLYGRIASHITRAVHGQILELGSGIGLSKRTIPDCRTTDIFDNPWLEGKEDAYRLTCGDNSISNLILLDVWHHLQYPGSALREFRRALAVGGRVIICDPAMSLLGRFVYGFFHHEPLGLWEKVQPYLDASDPEAGTNYFAAQSLAYRIFVYKEMPELLEGWNIRLIERFSSLEYLASGGFSKPQLYPDSAVPLIRQTDRILTRLPSVFAARVMVVLERSS